MGNPFAHIELSADDVASAKKFYKSVFDWKLDDMPFGDMTYTMIGVGKGTGGGMTPKMMGPQQPTAWLPYVEVADVAKSLEKAKTAGATVVVERTPIGENMGSFGIFVDPQGAHLGLWEAAKKAPATRSAAKKKPAKKAAKKAAKKKGKR